MGRRGDSSTLLACGQCGAPVTGCSAYYATDDATARCWPCHCRQVCGTYPPDRELDRDGQPVNGESS